MRKLTIKDESPCHLSPGDWDAITTRAAGGDGGADGDAASSSWLQEDGTLTGESSSTVTSTNYEESSRTNPKPEP